MTLSVKQLVGVINLLADPGSAANAAGILAREAAARGVLVADLMLMASSPPPATSAYRPPQRDPEPAWRNAKQVNTRPFVKSLGDGDVGLASAILSETPKAWLVEKPDGGQAWLAKSVVTNNGKDRRGRAYFSVPAWLAKKIQLAA